jgi:hypothetical protein
VGFQNSATGLDLGFYAARSYSLRRPPRTGRRRHQDRLEDLPGEEAVEGAVRDMALRARHYKRIIDPGEEEDEELRAGLLRLRRWGAQTSYPVLIAAYDLRERGLLPLPGVREVVSYIESFLVRRQLAGLSTNALNRLFVQFVANLPEDESFPQALRQELSRQRRYWPSDEAADADLLAHRRHHHRPGVRRGRGSHRPARRAAPHRDRRDLLQTRPQVPVIGSTTTPEC